SIHYNYVNLNSLYFFLFFNATPTAKIYTLSLHDALPIYRGRCPTPRSAPHLRAPPRGARESRARFPSPCGRRRGTSRDGRSRGRDRKSTRLNSSHSQISYAVFCLKKKKWLAIGLYRLQHDKPYAPNHPLPPQYKYPSNQDIPSTDQTDTSEHHLQFYASLK